MIILTKLYLSGSVFFGFGTYYNMRQINLKNFNDPLSNHVYDHKYSKRDPEYMNKEWLCGIVIGASWPISVPYIILAIASL